MPIERGGLERPKPITERLSPDELSAANKLWAIVQTNSNTLAEAEEKQSLKPDGLKQLNAWMNASPETLATDPEYQETHRAYNEGAAQIAEGAARFAAFIIARVIEKERTFTTTSAKNAAAEIEQLVTEASGEIAHDSLEDATRGRPRETLLLQEVSALSDMLTQLSFDNAWAIAQKYLDSHEVNPPLVAILKDSFKSFTSDFIAGQRIQDKKVARRSRQSEGSGK